MGIREKLLDEDCNRCEGDVPETRTVPAIPKKTVPVPKDVGSGELLEDESNPLDELKQLLGD